MFGWLREQRSPARGATYPGLTSPSRLALGLQGYLVASTNLNDDSLSVWPEMLNTPATLAAGTRLDLSFRLTATPPAVVGAPLPPAQPPVQPPGQPPAAAGPRITSARVLLSLGGKRALVLRLAFDEALDAARAEDLANYVLHAPGKGPKVELRSIPIRSAAYDAPKQTVTLTLGRTARGERWVLLTVNGTLAGGVADPAGNVLDGNGAGLAGGDAVFRLRVRSLRVFRGQVRLASQKRVGQSHVRTRSGILSERVRTAMLSPILVILQRPVVQRDHFLQSGSEGGETGHVDRSDVNVAIDEQFT
jgi:hypothetical protein